MKSRMALAAAAAASMTGLAHAQGSVALYGIVDEGITVVNNEGGAHNVRMESGVYRGSRWGLDGSEDLRGGMKAVFKLENGFSLDNGSLRQGGLIFGRQAYVGVSSPYGTLTLGRQYDATTDFAWYYNVAAIASGYGFHQGDLDRTLGDRLNNSVKYRSPDFQGLSAIAMYSFSNTAGAFHQGSAWSSGVFYNHGPFTAAAAYTYLAGTTFDPYAAMGLRSFMGRPVVTRVGDVVTPVEESFALNSLGTFGVGASYAIGDVSLIANVTNTRLKYQGDATVMQVYEAGATWQATPALLTALAYQHTRFEGHKWHQVSLGAYYSLSKRTRMYASVDYLKSSSGVDPVIAHDFAPSQVSWQGSARIGVLHNF
ncbi:porin [Paraburkholderia caledonica]|uniref:porin n=1 Tax=Paraburkholderia caledonica TaxID=134536 RepID=UPI0004899750|nr:porin [Paraburkholderia caledonica]